MNFSLPGMVEEEEAGLNMTPLIDVVFLLLIFFMVTSTLKDETALSVDLQESTASPLPVEKNALTLVINLEGEYFINGVLLPDSDVESLMSALQESAGTNPDPLLNIHADRNVAYEKVVRVMEAARRLGYEHLNVAVSKQ